MEVVVWPLVVLILGVAFMFVFKAPIGRFLDRTKSVSKEGVQAYDEGQQTTTKPDALAQFLEGYHSPLLLETETLIEEELKKRGLTNPTDAIKALRKSLAGILLALQFERVYNSIFTSQVAVLIFLNGRAGTPTPETELESFFTGAAAEYPKAYENRTFEEWLGFLTAQLLVLETKEGVAITVRGREFLKWRVDEGRAGPYYG